MTPLHLADPGILANIKPSVPECIDAWGTSFLIGRHIYGIRIETVPLADMGLECFFDEQGIDQPDDGLGCIVKFDNALNEVDEKSAYSRLLERELRNQVRQGRLSVMDYLTKHKGYKLEHARVLEPKFRRSIYEAAA